MEITLLDSVTNACVFLRKPPTVINNQFSYERPDSTGVSFLSRV